MYRKVNSSIVSEGAMNSFKEMFPLAVIRTHPHPLSPILRLNFQRCKVPSYFDCPLF